MDAEGRRRAIAAELARAGAPVSAAALAARLGVSRQVIVGDVALLRASGMEITATPRGYVAGGGARGRGHTLACVHGPEGMERELNIMVDNGCTVLDVIVEHPLYGQLTGPLQISNRYEVGQFLSRSRQSEALPLSELTEGIHLHTLSCPDEAAFQRARQALRELGILLEE